MSAVVAPDRGGGERVARGSVAQQLVHDGDRGRRSRGPRSSRAAGLIAGHGAAGVAGDHAFDHRADQRGHAGALALQLGQPAAEALVQGAQGAGQLADLVPPPRVEHGPLAPGDRLGGIAQPQQGARHVAGEPEGEDRRQPDGGEGADQDRALGAAHDLVHLGQRGADADHAKDRGDRDLQLLPPGGRALAQVGPGASRERGPHLGAGRMVFERGQLAVGEVRVGDHRALPIDDGQPPVGGSA